MTTRPMGVQDDTGPASVDFTPAVIARNALIVCAVVAAAAQVSVPLAGAAAPFTLQSLAIVLAGPLVGARAATAGVMLYLFAGALGAPVFANGNGGLEVLTGPTGGFLWTFLLLPTPLAHLARRVDGSWSGIWFASFLGAHALLLLTGFVWFAVATDGWSKLMEFTAFLPGTVLKSMLGVFVLRFTPTHVTRSRSRRRPHIGPDQ